MPDRRPSEPHGRIEYFAKRDGRPDVLHLRRWLQRGQRELPVECHTAVVVVTDSRRSGAHMGTRKTTRALDLTVIFCTLLGLVLPPSAGAGLLDSPPPVVQGRLLKVV